MLVLTRKLREEIVVPQAELTFTILEVHGDKVSIGITAPPEVRVYRREVWMRILDEIKEQQACEQPSSDVVTPELVHAH